MTRPGCLLSRIACALSLALALPLVPGAAPSASAAATPLTLRPALVAGARQLVVVTTASWSSTSAVVDRWELRAGRWVRLNTSSYSARVGRSGTRVVRREGDGSTPAGSFPLVSAFGLESPAATRLRYTRISAGHCWISDATSPAYNTLVRRIPCGSPNEDLRRIALAGPYRRAVVTGYNMDPVVAGRGSAIFLHLHSWRNGSTVPTSGCVSISAAAMDATWRWLDPAKAPRIVIGPAAWLTSN